MITVQCAVERNTTDWPLLGYLARAVIATRFELKNNTVSVEFLVCLLESR